MLDDFFTGILVFSFLAISAFAVLDSLAERVEPTPQSFTQLERVLVTSPNVKAERGG